jgi:DtxR family Mn-dependent transcriptional regulator
MQNSKKLSSNMEDYLEAIAVLKEKNGVVRVRDISRLLNVEPPSVASALNNLSGSGLVVHERYGYVELTPDGERLALDVQRRHDMLVKFLTGILSIDPGTAAEDACKMEHSMSHKTSERLAKFIEFVETCPDGNKPDWLRGFGHYFKTGRRSVCKARRMKQEVPAGK